MLNLRLRESEAGMLCESKRCSLLCKKKKKNQRTVPKNMQFNANLEILLRLNEMRIF